MITVLNIHIIWYPLIHFILFFATDRKGRSVSIGDVTINGVAHSGSSISVSPNKSNQNISATTKNTNAINSVVTLIKEEKCNGDDDRKVSIQSAENV